MQAVGQHIDSYRYREVVNADSLLFWQFMLIERIIRNIR